MDFYDDFLTQMRLMRESFDAASSRPGSAAATRAMAAEIAQTAAIDPSMTRRIADDLTASLRSHDQIATLAANSGLAVNSLLDAHDGLQAPKDAGLAASASLTDDSALRDIGRVASASLDYDGLAAFKDAGLLAGGLGDPHREPPALISSPAELASIGTLLPASYAMLAGDHSGQ